MIGNGWFDGYLSHDGAGELPRHYQALLNDMALEYHFDDTSCAECNEVVGGYLKADYDTGREDGAWSMMFVAQCATHYPLGALLCEDCAYGHRDIHTEEPS